MRVGETARPSDAGGDRADRPDGPATPEVIIKVLSQGGQDLKAVRRHLDHLRDREDGKFTIEELWLCFKDGDAEARAAGRSCDRGPPALTARQAPRSTGA